MQTVICNFKGCGFCSQSGFCLNRLLVINEQGVCKYLTKPGWERVPEDFEKSTYVKPEEEQEKTELLEEKSAAARAEEFLNRTKPEE